MMLKDVPGSKCLLQASTDGALQPSALKKGLDQVSVNPIEMLSALKVILQILNLVLNLLSYHIRDPFYCLIYNNSSYIWTF